MTKDFAVWNSCGVCGHQTSAETAFGRWLRDQEELDSRKKDIVRSDCDHIFLRYRTAHGRDFQLMMVVEVKEYGAEPDASQRDILSFFSQTIFHSLKGKNMHGASTVRTLRLKSWMTGRMVYVRNYGVHLLQFEKTDPIDSKWIKWDRNVITAPKLIEILAMRVRPDDPSKPIEIFLRDRHRQLDVKPSLFAGSVRRSEE
jgi:hypothetical protein